MSGGTKEKRAQPEGPGCPTDFLCANVAELVSAGGHLLEILLGGSLLQELLPDLPEFLVSGFFFAEIRA